MPVDDNDPILAPEELAAAPADFIVLDARDESAFAVGRVSGAVRLPIDVWERAAKNEATGFANTAFWAERIGELGVDGSRTAVILDDGRMTEAARVWFVLQYFGLRARVLDGGWPAIEPLIDPVSRESGTKPAARAATPILRPGTGRVALVMRAELRDGLARGEAPAVFDARTRDEHDGRDLRKNRRGGKLPGARNLPHSALLGPGNRLHAPEKLRALIGTAGFAPGEPLVTHCDGGGRAALAAIAALRAGRTGVATYYLSFSDWAADDSCPINS